MGRVAVVGAGVVGLTVAVELSRGGHRVDVVARDLPRETPSALGPGLWRPVEGEPGRGWAEQTYAALAQTAREAGSPVRMLPGRDAGGDRDVVVPVVDVPRYLDRLTAELLDRGGSLTRLQLSALPTGPDAVVDCTGLGARHFGADPSVVPVREQLVVVEDPGLPRWWTDGPATYVVPAGGVVLVGAVRQPWEWDRTPRTEQVARLLAPALRAVPELVGAAVLGSRVGLWPGRSDVRLERVGPVVHCYGHGAAGLTTSWGSARAVAALISG